MNHALFWGGGGFGVDGIAVFVHFEVGYLVISLKWCGISVFKNSAVNGFLAHQSLVFGIARETLEFSNESDMFHMKEV